MINECVAVCLGLTRLDLGLARRQCLLCFFRLACRCAKESSTKGHSHFGLQYYGECWSDPQAADKFDRYGESEDCMGFGFKQCDDEESSECVGGADKNYVYRVVEEGKFYLNIYLYLRFFSV